jgi:Na+-transporting methylmalonyl-CoA/oxaloacetate decarboxylase gamma subunit
MQAMKDQILVAIILVITGISVLLLFLWTAVPLLRGMAVMARDDENPFGETVSKHMQGCLGWEV